MLRSAILVGSGAAGLVVAALLTYAAPNAAAARRCTLIPGSTLALVRVERDTTLPIAVGGGQVMSSSGVSAGPGDSLLATPGTAMPAARVRLLRLDSASLAALAGQGVAGREPVAFLRAAPYRADCRTVRWTDTLPFAVPGETGFVRATLAPREQWVNGIPLLIVPDAWRYPYPRRRGLAIGATPDTPLASAAALFDLETALNATLEAPRPPVPADSAPMGREARAALLEALRERALAWARDNPAESEREPARELVRRAALNADWTAVSDGVSRLRGTYRVTMAAGVARGVWFFRTHDRPGYAWRGRDSVRTTADLLASPYSAGYRLVGYAARSPDSLGDVEDRWNQGFRGGERVPLVWLATEDRPTLPGNEARGVLSGMLEFNLAAVPESLWPALETLVPPMSAMDSAFLARSGGARARGERQPRVPITMRLDADGGVRGDTTVVDGGRQLRVLIERVDTLSLRRPF